MRPEGRKKSIADAGQTAQGAIAIAGSILIPSLGLLLISP